MLDAHQRLMIAAVVLSGTLLLSVSCNKPRQVETAKTEAAAPASPVAADVAPAAPTPDVAPTPPPEPAKEVAEAAAQDVVAEPAPEPDESGLPVATPTPKTPPDELREKLKKLKFKARREVVATRTTIENIPSYERALEKYEREFEQWQMYTHIPKEPRLDELKAAITEMTDRLGIEVLYYKAQLAGPPERPMPETIFGDKSFDFSDENVVRIHQVTVKVPKVERAKLEALVKEIKGLDRLVLVHRIRPEHSSILINMATYHFPEERYPLHKAEPRELARRLNAMGISESIEELMEHDPVGYLQNAALSFKEINASLPKLNEALALLSRSKFLAARSAFYRKTFEEARKPTAVP